MCRLAIIIVWNNNIYFKAVMTYLFCSRLLKLRAQHSHCINNSIYNFVIPQSEMAISNARQAQKIRKLENRFRFGGNHTWHWCNCFNSYRWCHRDRTLSSMVVIHSRSGSPRRTSFIYCRFSSFLHNSSSNPTSNPKNPRLLNYGWQVWSFKKKREWKYIV